VITNERVLNFNGVEMKRAISITDLVGITKSLEKKGKIQFVIHVANDYDYRFKDGDKQMDAIVDVVKRLYFEKMTRNLPIFGVQTKVKKFV